MVGFLSLPREIRNMIYQLALVVDEVLTPYNEHYPLKEKDLAFRKRLPTVALLGVSKLVQLEAAEYLYGGNTWRISSIAPTLFARSTLFGNERYVTMWNLRADYFKNMVTVFDQQDIDREDMHYQMCWLRKSEPELSSEKRMQEAHSLGEVLMADSWYNRMHALALMPNLESLSVEVGRLACHPGCCRKETLRDLMQYFVEVLEYWPGKEAHSLENRVKVGLELSISGLDGQQEEHILKASKFPATIV